MVCNATVNGSSILETSAPTHWVYTLVECIVTLLIFGTNSITITVITKEKSFWNPSGYFMVQLAITDMLTGVFLTSVSIPASIMNEWPYGKIFCNIAGLFGTSAASLSILTLALIAYDRFLVITNPFHYETIMTKRKALIYLMIIWIYNITFQAMPFAIPTWTDDQKYVYFPNMFTCSFAFHNNVIYVILSICVIFVPASAVINVCCLKMCTTARSHVKAIQKQSAPSAETKRSLKNMNAVKTTAFIIGAFFLTWGPFLVFCVYRTLIPCDEIQDIPRALEFAIGTIATSNSFMNFFIYSVRNRKFRESAGKVLCFRKCTSKMRYFSSHGNQSRSATIHPAMPSSS